MSSARNCALESTMGYDFAAYLGPQARDKRDREVAVREGERVRGSRPPKIERLSEDELLAAATHFGNVSSACEYAVPVVTSDDLGLLPAGSFFLSLKFTMATSYLSRDDEPWNKKNPIVRDWVSRVPYVRPTTWKGRLRFAARQAGADPELIHHLFGNEKNEPSVFQEGRLHFYPTFFKPAENAVVQEVDEVINPHGRASRMGTVPVKLGAVSPVIPVKPVKPGDPETTRSTGTFAVLYLADSEERSKGIAESCCQWIADALAIYGIGAKTLKGYGLAQYKYKVVAFLPTKPGVKALKDCDAGNLWERVAEVVPWI